MSAPPAFIGSRANALLVRLRKLARDPVAYRRLGEVLLEGDHLCRAWVERGGAPARHALLAESACHEPALVDLAATAQSSAIVADALMPGIGRLDSAAPIVFVVPLPPVPAIDPVAPSVVLDRIQDAGNAGSILRSAAAFGFRQVLALPGTASLWSPKVLRAAMGAHFSLALVEGVGLDGLATLRVPLVATSSHAAEALAAARLPWPCAWVFGNEGQGLSSDVDGLCAQRLRIAQPGGEESLNVAAAAAVCLYESSRAAGPAAARGREQVR